MSVRVKICGVTNVEDALVAADAGASAIGLVFWPESRRAVSLEIACRIAGHVPREVSLVGVFVNEPVGRVAEIAARVPLGAVQLHGDERLEPYAAAVSLPIVKAIAVAEGDALPPLESIPDDVLPLLDAHDELRRGGTGRTIDWTLAARAAARRRIALAGGLTPENIALAIRMVRPYAVDISSGVERAPGLKDAGKIRTLLWSARETAGDIPRGLQ